MRSSARSLFRFLSAVLILTSHRGRKCAECCPVLFSGSLCLCGKPFFFSRRDAEAQRWHERADNGSVDITIREEGVHAFVNSAIPTKYIEAVQHIVWLAQGIDKTLDHPYPIALPYKKSHSLTYSFASHIHQFPAWRTHQWLVWIHSCSRIIE